MANPWRIGDLKPYQPPAPWQPAAPAPPPSPELPVIGPVDAPTPAPAPTPTQPRSPWDAPAPVPPARPSTVPAPQPHAGPTFCRNCGNPIHPQAVACLTCGVPPYAGTTFCPHCCAGTHPQAVMCVRCGRALAAASYSGGPFGGPGPYVPPGGRPAYPMEPALACLLSLVLPGVGQMVCGQVVKGIVMLIGTVVLLALCIWPGFIAWCIIAFDAFQIAQKLKSGRRVGDWECF